MICSLHIQTYKLCIYIYIHIHIHLHLHLSIYIYTCPDQSSVAFGPIIGITGSCLFEQSLANAECPKQRLP